MYRPTIKSNLWLGLMTVAFLALYFLVDNSQIEVKAPQYDIKIKAAQTMLEAMDVLKDHRLPQFEKKSSEDRVDDPLFFTFLGEKDSPITTDEGSIEDKITVLNPNFAAAIVEMFADAGLSRGDTIAVLLTGSMPGANLALFSAMKVYGLFPVIITSVGSSWWGANSPDFTWLDMEQVLLENEVFDFYTTAASIGGSDDQGGLRLSGEGRELIIEAISRNEVTLIHEGGLSSNIEARKKLFKRLMPLADYKAVVNIGGGIAAIGNRHNAELIPTGVNNPLPLKNYPNLGVIHHFSDEGIPVIQIGNARKVAKMFDLPIAQLPLPEIGIGKVFTHKQYNLTTAWAALLAMFLILGLVKYFDQKRYQWKEQKVDPENIV